MVMAKQHKSPRERGRQVQARGLWLRGKWWFTGGGAAGAMALLVVLSLALSTPQIPVGRVLAPDIALATANGAFQLSDHRGRGLAPVFLIPRLTHLCAGGSSAGKVPLGVREPGCERGGHQL